MIEEIFVAYIFFTMFLIGSIHVYWLNGGLWPAKSKQEFLKKVFGRKKGHPTLLNYLFIITVIFTISLIPVLVYFDINPFLSTYSRYIYCTLTVLFFLRSIYLLVPLLANKGTKMFLKYDRKYYRPLAFSLSIAHFVLFFSV